MLTGSTWLAADSAHHRPKAGKGPQLELDVKREHLYSLAGRVTEAIGAGNSRDGWCIVHAADRGWASTRSDAPRAMSQGHPISRRIRML